MRPFPFSKLSGSGNDFILTDNRSGRLSAGELARLAPSLCRRKFSIGADGFIAIETSEKADFRWRFFNSDGSVAEMCGNGGRCAARFAVEKGIAASPLSFETLAGVIRAEVRGRRVKLELTPPTDFRPRVEAPLEDRLWEGSFLNTGVPHLAIPLDGLEAVGVREVGRALRRHPLFAPQGTNVDFVEKRGESRIAIRTYERGVEDETLACGTGAVASACIASFRWGLRPPVEVLTRGGEVLVVHLSRAGDGFAEVFLEGDTLWVYDGQFTDEACL